MNRQDAKSDKSTKRPSLPALLRPLFWDYDFKTLTWDDDRDLIIARVLASGTWEAIIWLRAHLGDQALREWIERRRGRGLSPRQLRFWEVMLDLPHRQVNAWLQAEGAQDLGSESQSVSFRPHVLGTVQQKVLRQLGPLMDTQRFYLGGGTALAIHLGHRR